MPYLLGNALSTAYLNTFSIYAEIKANQDKYYNQIVYVYEIV